MNKLRDKSLLACSVLTGPLTVNSHVAAVTLKLHGN